jgi:Arc/MetJ family transcription regulator
MRTTINLDDALLARAMEVTTITDRTALLHEGLRALIARQAARDLIALGGSDPHATLTPRRRAA